MNLYCSNFTIQIAFSPQSTEIQEKQSEALKTDAGIDEKNERKVSTQDEVIQILSLDELLLEEKKERKLNVLFTHIRILYYLKSLNLIM